MASFITVLTRIQRWFAHLPTRLRAVEPESWDRVGQELRAGRMWLDRAVVLAFAVATGLLVAGFTLLSEWAHQAFEAGRHGLPHGTWLTLLWTPAVAAAVVWWMRRWAPGAAGSGIPQVIRALDAETPGAEPPAAWVSLRTALHKVALVCAGLLGGLSLGREGPTVQVGAGVMAHARRWLSPGASLDAHDLMVAGAAAGVAAAFNTPLGGVVFALEQLSRRRHHTHSTLVIASIVVAGLVSVSLFGNETYFGRLRVPALTWEMLMPGVLVALLCGAAGGLLSRLVVVSLQGLPDRWSRWRVSYPCRFAAGCGFAVALIGIVTGGATAGAGHASIRSLLDQQATLPEFFTLLKLVATWLSVWSGAPGGLFAPSLTIGAGVGHDVASAFDMTGPSAVALIALGMVGFLAATTQGPITAFIIVMEMVAGHAMVLSLMACAFLSSGVSRLLARPLYAELAGLWPLPASPKECHDEHLVANTDDAPRRLVG